MRWTRRIVVVSVFGYALAEVGLLLGLSDAAHEAAEGGRAGRSTSSSASSSCRSAAVRRGAARAAGATGPVAALRNWLARVWHWLALLLLAGLWLVWAVEVPHGYARMLRYFASVVVVAVVARLAQIVILGALDRVMRPSGGESRYPGVEARLALYHPVLVSIARALIFWPPSWPAAALGTWHLRLAGRNHLGRRLMSSLLTLRGDACCWRVAVWEAVNAAIERHLAKLTREAQAARSARLRTLLPLLRTTLLITILIVAGMMVLSEIGVNIGPLLAGAGIVGVAIGFGSQKLVQDLITGIFLLLENAMQVGDSVTVSGLSGTVENLSVRTIRLRAGDGSVHLIPFSAVTTVTNMNRGLGNASVNVTLPRRRTPTGCARC